MSQSNDEPSIPAQTKKKKKRQPASGSSNPGGKPSAIGNSNSISSLSGLETLTSIEGRSQQSRIHKATSSVASGSTRSNSDSGNSMKLNSSRNNLKNSSTAGAKKKRPPTNNKSNHETDSNSTTGKKKHLPRKNPPKKHPPKEQSSRTLETHLQPPLSPPGRQINRRASTLDLTVSSPVNPLKHKPLSSRTLNHNDSTTTPSAESGNAEQSRQPTRGVKRYSSMPVTMQSRKEMSSNNPTANMRSLDLASICEQRPLETLKGDEDDSQTTPKSPSKHKASVRPRAATLAQSVLNLHKEKSMDIQDTRMRSANTANGENPVSSRRQQQMVASGRSAGEMHMESSPKTEKPRSKFLVAEKQPSRWPVSKRMQSSSLESTSQTNSRKGSNARDDNTTKNDGNESDDSNRRNVRSSHSTKNSTSQEPTEDTAKGVSATLLPSRIASSRKMESQRRLPTRSQSSDLLEHLRLAAPPTQESNEDEKRNSRSPERGIRHSRSGDLESLQESSMHNRTGIHLPPSILKNSSHHTRGILKNSSHHHFTLPPRDPSTRARFPENSAITPAIPPDVDDDIDVDSFSEESIEEVSIVFDDEPAPTTKPRPSLGARRGSRPGLLTSKSKSFLDISGHSFMTTRSMLSVEKETAFEDDPWYKSILRTLRILPPYPNERPIKKKIRILVWITLFLDFIAAMVAITTYDGVTTCCGEPIYSLSLVDVNWSLAIRISTYAYLLMIFAEIIPVVRHGLPFNIINPMVGFTITFGMFFDDRILEAVCMWIIEATAIYCEFLVYRCQTKEFSDRSKRLEGVERDLVPYLSGKNWGASSSRLSTHSRRIGSSSHSKRLSLSSGSSRHSPQSGSGESSDEDSMSGASFGEVDELGGSQDFANDNLPGELDVSRPDIGGNPKLRKVRLLRERRILRQKQKTERVQLRYHFGGVLLNFSLVCISLILIIAIASSGGLCIIEGQRPVVFDMNQLDTCSVCRGQIKNGVCQICDLETGFVCYFQYI